MKKTELFTKDMLETFKCHPYAEAPRRSGEGVILSDVYGNYSDAKERAYNYCRKLCDHFNGRDFENVSHNTMAFSVQFENPLNGCIMLAFITRYHNHLYFK